MTSPVSTADPLFPARWLGVAEAVCERFYAAFPDHDVRYGGRGRAFCAHDNAYLVSWLLDVLDGGDPASFATNVAWLRSLLNARGFPMDAFSRNLDFVRDAVTEIRPQSQEHIRALIAAAQASPAA